MPNTALECNSLGAGPANRPDTPYKRRSPGVNRPEMARLLDHYAIKLSHNDPISLFEHDLFRKTDSRFSGPCFRFHRLQIGPPSANYGGKRLRSSAKNIGEDSRDNIRTG